MTKEEQLCKWFFSFSERFSHYSFFTKKLWKKVKGFEKEDKAEIECAFMCYWLHLEYEQYDAHHGVKWFTKICPTFYENYIRKYKPVIDAFEKWKEEQR